MRGRLLGVCLALAGGAVVSGCAEELDGGSSASGEVRNLWNPGPRHSPTELGAELAVFSGSVVEAPAVAPERPEVTVPTPEVSYPYLGARVANPVQATGSALPFADIRAEVRVAGRVVGTARASADEAGRYAVEIPYNSAPIGSEVVVCVAQVVDQGISLAATVSAVQGAAPSAPELFAPVADASVSNQIPVRGRGEAGAFVWALALDSQSREQLGVIAMLAGHDGGFGGELFVETPPSGVVHIELFQESALGTSAPETHVVYYEPQILSGRVLQVSGRSDGRRTFVRVYDDPHSAVHLYEAVLETPDGSYVDQRFSLTVPRGEYWIRAFRDGSGLGASGLDEGPDAEPTLPDDPQAPAVGPVLVESDVDDVVLRLRDVSRAGAPLRAFNVFAVHDGLDAERSEECGGFRLVAGADAVRAPRYTIPRLVAPNGSESALSGDGGCGDVGASAEAFVSGWANPTSGDSGRFRTYVRHRAMDVLSIAADDVVVRRLPRLVELTSPSPAEASMRVVYASWAEIPGVVSSRVVLGGEAGVIEDSGPITQRQFQAAERVADDAYYSLRFEHYDVDLAETADYDSVARTIPFGFFVDVDGADTVQLRGTVEARREAPAPIVLSAASPSGAVTALVPEEGGAFVLTVPRSASELTIEAFVDRDLSGDPASAGNGGTAARVLLGSSLEDLEGVALALEHRVLVTSPRDQETVSRRPTFAWRGVFGVAPAGEWSYHLRAEARYGGDGRALSLVVPATVTEVDLGQRPREAFDAGLLMSCAARGGVLSGGTCSVAGAVASPASLPRGSDWVWSVEVIACSQAPRTAGDIDGNGQDDFSDCVAEALSNQRVLGTSLLHHLSVR
jgi:hypothetical protein